MIVVADTSIIINLCCVGRGNLLRQLFREVVVPPAVVVEFTRLAAAVPRFTSLTLPEGIRQQAATTALPAVLSSAAGLDPGEKAALALAVEIHADAVLLDERRGREVASQLGLRTMGLLGVLLQAKAAGLVSRVRPVLDDLQREAGFWIGQSLREQVLRHAGE